MCYILSSSSYQIFDFNQMVKSFTKTILFQVTMQSDHLRYMCSHKVHVWRDVVPLIPWTVKQSLLSTYLI